MIFFHRFEVEPAAESPNWAEYGGGQFKCWIRATTQDAARERTLEVIASNGWHITREEESRRLDDDFYEPGTPGSQAYDEAQSRGESFVVHTWPVDEGEGSKTQ